MLEELSKYDAKWREIAFKYCKDRMTADDIVNDMYLKLSGCTKTINEFYVIMTIKSIFIDHYRKIKYTVSIEDKDFISNDNNFELCDTQTVLVDKIKWWEKEIVEMYYDYSLREIAEELNINYLFVHRTIQIAKHKANV